MAHYNVTCSCGHTDRVDLYGKTSEREYRISQLKTEPCTACREAARAERSAKEAAEFSTKLHGSDKQVAWALDIRANAMRIIKRIAKPEAQEELANAVESMDSAAWWIDNRYDIVRAVNRVAIANRA